MSRNVDIFEESLRCVFFVVTTRLEFAAEMKFRTIFPGTGYELTITRMDGGNTSALDAVIKGALPEAEKMGEKFDEIVYKLPLTQTASFPQLFKSLEARQRELGIANMGVSCTTMEQVFLKYVRDVVDSQCAVVVNLMEFLLGCVEWAARRFTI